MKRPYGNGKTVRIYARVTPEVKAKLDVYGGSIAEAIENILKKVEKNNKKRLTLSDKAV